MGTRKKRSPGRPPGHTYRETIPVRLTEEAMSGIDAWVKRQGEEISRSEAIRRLLDRALAAEGGSQGKADAAANRSIQEARIALERALAALRRLARATSRD